MYSIIVTILLVIVSSMYLVVRKHNRELSMDSTRKLAEADARLAVLQDLYNKSEEGITQICENYENDALNLQDHIKALENARDIHLADLMEKEHLIEHHATHCHGIVEDTIDLIMERLRPIHPEEEPEGVAADG